MKHEKLYSDEIPYIDDFGISPFSRHLIIKKETFLSILNQEKHILLDLAESLKIEQESWIKIQGFLPRGLSNDLPFIEIAIEQLSRHVEAVGKHESVNRERNLSIPDYYFFMEKSGGHAYLSHLDIKILKQEFHEYSEFPAEIEVYILHTADFTLDEVSRRRIKYLSYLPLNCTIV